MSIAALLSHHSMPSDPVIYRFEKLESTNTTLKRLAAEGAAHGTMVTAQLQTDGRGRQGRNWHSPKGNLYMSLLWRPGRNSVEWSCLPLVAGLGVHEAISSLLQETGTDTTPLTLKWPNDLLYGGAKLGGILCEAEQDSVIVGLGINIAWHPDDTPYPATSLQDIASMTLDPAMLLKRVAAAMNKVYSCWDVQGFSTLHPACETASIATGTELTVRLPGDQFQGTYQGITPTGALRLQLPDKSLRLIEAGEVFPVMPDTESA